MIALAAFVIFFSLGLAPIPFMYASEIFPQRYRDLLTGVSISTYYTLTAVVTLAFGVLYPMLGVRFRNFNCLWGSSFCLVLGLNLEIVSC